MCRRVPGMVWYRLKWSLTRDGWLTSRQCDGVTVTQWSHRRLSDAVRQRYLSSDSTRRQLHTLLATYWLGLSLKLLPESNFEMLLIMYRADSNSTP